MVCSKSGRALTRRGYKSLKKLCKYYAKAGDGEKLSGHYEELLKYLDVPSVAQVEKGILGILDTANCLSRSEREGLIDRTISAVGDRSTLSRVWLKLRIRKAQLMVDEGKYEEVEPVLAELVRGCFLDDGREDPMKTHLLIELYGLQVQVYSRTNNMRKLQQLCGRINFSDRSISNPRVLGVVMESSGRVRMCNADYTGAKNDFFDAFKSMDEIGDSERVNALKYTVLAHMLSGSRIDLFQAQEVKSYQTHPDICGVYRVYEAFNGYNIGAFRTALDATGSGFADLSGVKEYIPQLFEKVRANAIVRLCKCYKRMKLSFLASELGLDEASTELLVLGMIFDGSLKAKINQFERYVVVSEAETLVTRKYVAIADLGSVLLNAASL